MNNIQQFLAAKTDAVAGASARTTKHEAKFAETDAGEEPLRFQSESQRG